MWRDLKDTIVDSVFLIHSVQQDDLINSVHADNLKDMKLHGKQKVKN